MARLRRFFRTFFHGMPEQGEPDLGVPPLYLILSDQTPPHRESRCRLLSHAGENPSVPYWQLRGWRPVGNAVYLGHFKTTVGRRHGVIKWLSRFDFGVYIHDVPESILVGPYGGCFTEVKPGKFRVHFAEIPTDINSVIFYIESLLQEGLENE